jgi:hypothetical protein
MDGCTVVISTHNPLDGKSRVAISVLAIKGLLCNRSPSAGWLLAGPPEQGDSYLSI